MVLTKGHKLTPREAPRRAGDESDAGAFLGGVNDSTARERCLVVVCIVRSNQCEAAPDFSVCAEIMRFCVCFTCALSVKKRVGKKELFS